MAVQDTSPQTPKDDGFIRSFVDGNFNCVSELLDEGVNLFVTDHYGRDALHYACSHGRSTMVKELVETYGLNPNAQSNDGKTPLHRACIYGHEEVVKYLVCVQNVQPDLTDQFKMTPLHYACESGSLGIVKLLVTKCNTNAKNYSGWTPLYFACKHGHDDIVSYLIDKHGLDLCMATDRLNLSPLHCACQHGSLVVVKKLIEEYNCDPNCKDNQNRTLLHIACEYGRTDVVKYLISTCGLDPSSKDYKGSTPLSCAYQGAEPRQNIAVIKLLIEEFKCDPPPPPNGTSIEVLRYLHHRQGLPKELISAFKKQNMDKVKYLVEVNRYNPCAMIDGEMTLLHYACQEGYSDTVKFLLERSTCNPELIQDSDGRTLLHYACNLGYTDIAEYLVCEQSIDPCAVDTFDQTPVYYACQQGHIDIVKLFVETHKIKAHYVHDLMKHWTTKPHTAIIMQYLESHITKQKDLVVACKEGNLKEVNNLIQSHCNPYERDQDQLSPLQHACTHGHIECVAHILSIEHLKGNNPGSLLHIACQNGYLDLVKMLVEVHKFELNDVDEHYNTPLDYTVYCGHVDIFWYLLNKGCSPDNAQTPQMMRNACKVGDLQLLSLLIKKYCTESVLNITSDYENKASLLHIACQGGHLNIVQYLIESFGFDPNVVDAYQQTPLQVACTSVDITEQQALQIVIYLTTVANSDPHLKDASGRDALLLASIAERASIVHFLLVQCHCDLNTYDNEGNVPLLVTNNHDVIKELLECKASPNEMYKAHSKLLGKQLQPPVKVFVVGNPSAGKSTLAAGLQVKKLAPIVRAFSQPRKVKGVDKKTAGIVTHEFETKKWGNIALYDFAGQREFYGSHAALLQNAIRFSPPIFLFVTDISKKDEEIKHSILFWLSFVANQCGSVEGKPHVIVIGSHVDIVKSNKESVDSKIDIVESLELLPQFKQFELVGVVAMDCQYSESPGMTSLKRILKQSCQSLRKRKELNFNAHCFLVYCLDKFQKLIAVQMEVILGQIKTDFSNTSFKSSDVLKFLPVTLEDLISLCEDLNDRGHLLFLKDSVNDGQSWVIFDKETLLKKVTGTIFAPKGFSEHCQLATSTGVVPLTKLQSQFPPKVINTEMLVGYLSHLEFCCEISDTTLLELINKHCEALYSTNSTSGHDSRETASNPDTALSLSERYFLFPGLITINAPDSVWEYDPNIKYHFGWILQCSQTTKQFFIPRFLQVLLLRLAFSFALVPDESDIREDVPSLQRKCAVWKSGIYWCNRDGVETLVEEVNHSTAVVVLMRCRKLNAEFLQLRSCVFRTVLEAVKTHCGKLCTYESVIDPSDVVNYPLKPVSELTLFSIREIAATVCEGRDSVMSSITAKPLVDMLLFEPYADFGDAQILHKLFDEQSSMYTSEVTNRFLSSIAEYVPDKADMFEMIFKTNRLLLDERISRSAISGNTQKMIVVLQIWRDSCEGTYKCLREKLDQFSIFAGRNPLLLQPTSLSPEYSKSSSDSPQPLSSQKESDGQSQRCGLSSQVHESDPHQFNQSDTLLSIAAKDLSDNDKDSIASQDSTGDDVTVKLGQNGGSSAKHSNPQDVPLVMSGYEHDTSVQGILSVDGLKKVRTAAWDARVKWYDIGIELGIRGPTLAVIKQNHRHEVNECFTAMIEEWLQNEELMPSWISLVEALKAPPVDQGHVADEIEKKYCL